MTIRIAVASPPSALPGISPSRGEISLHQSSQLFCCAGRKVKASPRIISPLEGKMGGSPEGGAALNTAPYGAL